MWNITTKGKTTSLDQADPTRYIRHPDGSESFIVQPGDKTTGTSSSPRTEKREMPGNWKLADAAAHVLFGRFVVEQMPASGKLIVGQIHAKDADAPAVKVLTLRGKLRCEARQAPGDFGSPTVLEAPLLDGENWYVVGVSQDGRGIVYLNGQYAYFEIKAWSKHLCYFKQGAYSIDDSSPARVRFMDGGYQHGRVAALQEALDRMQHPLPTPEPEQPEPKFKLGDLVRKIKGSQWHGRVVGTYSTELTPEGYAVESSTEKGSVQIYPAAALELWEAGNG